MGGEEENEADEAESLEQTLGETLEETLEETLVGGWAANLVGESETGSWMDEMTGGCVCEDRG